MVVLPWVPATTSGRRPVRKKRDSASGIEMRGMPLRSIATASGLVRGTALPTITRSGGGSRCAGSKPTSGSISALSSSVLIGG